MMEQVEGQVLQACHELGVRIGELFPLLEQAVGAQGEEVFYTWVLRQCRQSGQLPGATWRYFFHGYECDLKHLHNGRFLRLDFGPQGRLDTFSAWGVLQFIMASVAPWSAFDDLKPHFAQKGPPFNELSGDFNKFVSVWEKLEEAGYFEMADPALVQFREKHTSIRPDGSQWVTLPSNLPEKTRIDSSVAHRKTLSRHGYEALRKLPPLTS